MRLPAIGAAGFVRAMHTVSPGAAVGSQAVASRLEEVTVFSDRALVVRVGEFSPADSPQSTGHISIGPLPLLLDDTSLRLESLTSTVRFRDVRVELSRRADVEAGALPRSAVEILMRELAGLRARVEHSRRLVAELEGYVREPLPGRPLLHGREHEAPLFPAERYLECVNFWLSVLESQQARQRELERTILEKERELTRKQELPSTERPAADPEQRWSKQVVVRLEFDGDRPTTVRFRLSYLLGGARWSPAAVLNVNDDARGVRADLALTVRVAQNTGEDWSGVRLRFSAAALTRQTRLPDLPARRLGRVQPPRSPALRPAPQAPAELFAAFERWLGTTPPPVVGQAAGRFPEFMRRVQNLLELAGSAAAPPAPPFQAVPPPPPFSPPAPIGAGPGVGAYASGVPAPAARAAAFEPQELAAGAADFDEAADSEELSAVPALSLDDVDALLSLAAGVTNLPTRSNSVQAKSSRQARAVSTVTTVSVVETLDYREFRMSGPEEAGRGTLRPTGALDANSGLAEEARAALEAANRRAGRLVDPGPTPGATDTHFFHIYEARGSAEVPADGAVHVVAIDAREDAPAVFEYRAAGRTDARVYRRLILDNPFDLPLPAAPLAVYLDGAFAFSGTLPAFARGGRAPIPLGVEERIKLARNVRYREQSAGLMGGSLTTTHEIELELKSQLGRPASVVLLEILPVPADLADKDIHVRLRSADWAECPEYEEFHVRGLHRRSVELQAGEKLSTRFEYEVSIPAKKEIVGGNRRE